jgi:hypothetical protein
MSTLRQPAHRVEPSERELEVNAMLDRIESDVKAAIFAGAAYALELRLKRLFASDALGKPTPDRT